MGTKISSLSSTSRGAMAEHRRDAPQAHPLVDASWDDMWRVSPFAAFLDGFLARFLDAERPLLEAWLRDGL